MKTHGSYPDCYKCGKPVSPREDQAVIRFEGEEVLFQRVPMGVCAGCGERYLTAAAAGRMERALLLCCPVADVTPGAMRALRDALGLPREALASRLGVSSQSVFRWETGRSKPSRLATARLEALRAKAAGKRRRRHKEAL